MTGTTSVILVNNTVYAMTGGQLAPTTLPGQITETTPYGRDVAKTGYPTRGPEMLAAITTDGAYIARGTVAKFRQMKNFIKRAVQNQMEGNGFSFVECLSTCPTNWRTNARQTWDFLEDEMEAYFKVGELKSPFGKGEK